ncbi:MAG: hypothetical protein KC502_02575 [Myxococcales bacterium]|nr:hypothetical protein [Myxococcales bacterium]
MDRRSTRLLNPTPVAVIVIALIASAMTAGCGKVEEMKKAAIDKAAESVAAQAEKQLADKKGEAEAEANKKAAFDKAVAAAVDKAIAKRDDKAAADKAAAARVAEEEVGAAADTSAGEDAAAALVAVAADYDEPALASIRAMANCKRVYSSSCKPYAELTARCKKAWSARRTDAMAHDKLWRTLLHGIVSSESPKSRYGATMLANFKCRVAKSQLADEAVGRELLGALRREGKEGHAATRMAELLSKWWRSEMPGLHTSMVELVLDKDHPAPAARRELIRLGGMRVGKVAPLGAALIRVASTDGDDAKVRGQAVRNLWRMVGTPMEKEALETLTGIAMGRPGELTVDAFGALGDAASIPMWPELLKHYRGKRADPILGAAMAKATWRYAVVKYPKGVDSLPVRLSAFTTAVEVAQLASVPENQRFPAVYAIGRGGHPKAKDALERIAAGSDKVLGRAANRALKTLAPVAADMAGAAGPVGRPTRAAQRPKRAQRPSKRPRPNKVGRPGPSRPRR